MDMIAYYYLWVFIIVQIFSFLKAYAVFDTPQVGLKNRVLASLFTIVRATVSVWLGFKLLGTLESGVLDSVWIMVAVAIVSLIEIVATWVVENRLLGAPLPTIKDFFS